MKQNIESCDLKKHLFENGGLTLICSKCLKTFEEYQEDLEVFIKDYRNNKKS
jgi:hypothetical protein